MVCVNRERNEKTCPCEEKDCPRHGVCCECIAFHRNSKQWPKTACMR
jgi:hypothetical protein